MRTLLTTLFTFVSLTCFGQLSVYLIDDTLSRYNIDTIRVSGDSSFITIQLFNNGQLIHKEEQVSIRLKATSSNCNGEGADLYAMKYYFHGNSIQWYSNGQLKCKGSFTFSKKNADWKYWNENGEEIPEPISSEDGHSRRGPQYYIDGVNVTDENKKKKSKRQWKE